MNLISKSKKSNFAVAKTSKNNKSSFEKYRDCSLNKRSKKAIKGGIAVTDIASF